jgi:hypothetical protein
MHAECGPVYYLITFRAYQSKADNTDGEDLQPQDSGSQRHYNKPSILLHCRIFVGIRLSGGFSRTRDGVDGITRTIKSVNLSYLSTFVVSAEKGDLFRISKELLKFFHERQ